MSVPVCVCVCRQSMNGEVALCIFMQLLPVDILPQKQSEVEQCDARKLLCKFCQYFVKDPPTQRARNQATISENSLQNMSFAFHQKTRI